nr:MAG TPA: hypothetical protein [Caudoviricetes sp.]
MCELSFPYYYEKIVEFFWFSAGNCFILVVYTGCRGDYNKHRMVEPSYEIAAEMTSA